MRWTGIAAAFVIVGTMWAFYRLLTVDHEPPVDNVFELPSRVRKVARPFDWERDA